MLPPRPSLFSRLQRPGPGLPIALATALLAWVATRGILAATGGEPAVPLDDTFIHFRFAATFAGLHPFEYSPGAAPVAGATSLLWPLLLAPFHALGLTGTRLIWVAWAGGWFALGLLAYDTLQVSRGLLSPGAALGATAMVLAFGGHLWCAGSGMEVVPLAWLLMRSVRRVAEHAESAGALPPRARHELLALAWLAPLMRPEGALASLLIAATMLRFPRSRRRATALLPLAGPLLPSVINFIATGDAATTTMAAKWLFASPYPESRWSTLLYHLHLFFHTLLDGREWSAIFVPRGGKWVAWLALPALLWATARRRRGWRGGAVIVVALGMLATTTYESFLVNRLRYLWPFAAAWCIGLGAVADAVGLLAPRCGASVRGVRAVVAGAFVGLFAAQYSWTMEDLATSSRAIHQQQVALARWAARDLPRDALIGVNDAGAIAYLADRRTFDLVGLTTRDEARHWAAGPGSRFERWEQLGRERLPTHLIVYDRWLQVPAVLGRYLTHRYVAGATILGDSTMTAYEARWDALGSGSRPREFAGATLHDRLDVADLESEAQHAYALFRATGRTNVAFEAADGRVDGGRSARERDRFELELRPGALLVARLITHTPLRLVVRVDELTLPLDLTGDGDWEEVAIELPRDLPAGRRTVTVTAAPSGQFASLHYWALTPAPNRVKLP